MTVDLQEYEIQMIDDRRIYVGEDTQLMIKVSEGDRDAYTILYNKYFSAVVSLAATLNGQLQSPEDVAQEVFCRIWEKREEYRPAAAFKTFLFGYAKKVLKENIASAVKELTLKIDELSDLIAKPHEFEATSQNKDITAYLEKVVANLPERQKQSFVLVFIMGLSSAKAAKILNCSLDAVHSALFRARKTLRSLSGSFPFGIG